jgi:putative flavoprotein involved in K+ transport
MRRGVSRPIDQANSPSEYEAIVCGAGPAGLSSAASLQKLGIRTLILERSGHVGSSWRSRYDTLRLNTLGWMSTLPGYHVGRRLRRFPSRDEWVDYLERYAAHHGLRIKLHTEVERIDRENGGWLVQTTGADLRSRFVVIATGYDREPALPDWPGRETFTGELIHAAQYRNADPYRGRDVLVVGPNVTGSEVAFFLADGGAGRVRVATRTPPNILRRCRFGIPLNPAAVALERLPAGIGDRVTALSQRLTFGDLSDYGLPRPPMGVVSNNRKRRQGPALDDGFVEAVKRGKIEIVPGVEAFEGADVILADRSRIQPDAVIAATGYRRGLEALVGHLGILDPAGYPVVMGARTHPRAPAIYFAGYATPLYGQLRGIRLEAKRVARAVAEACKTDQAP